MYKTSLEWLKTNLMGEKIMFSKRVIELYSKGIFYRMHINKNSKSRIYLAFLLWIIILCIMWKMI